MPASAAISRFLLEKQFQNELPFRETRRKAAVLSAIQLRIEFIEHKQQILNIPDQGPERLAL